MLVTFALVGRYSNGRHELQPRLASTLQEGMERARHLLSERGYEVVEFWAAEQVCLVVDQSTFERKAAGVAASWPRRAGRA